MRDLTHTSDRRCEAPLGRGPDSVSLRDYLQEIVMPVLNLLKRWILPTALLLALGACAGDATTRSTGRYIDDATITASVKSKLIDDEMVKARNINVETYKGVVSLSGFVESKAEANQAIMLAQQVEGVKSVKDDMNVR
jgi:hyperosmotically inducible protein